MTKFDVVVNGELEKACQGKGRLSKVMKSEFTPANKKHSLGNSIWHVSITRQTCPERQTGQKSQCDVTQT